MGGARVFATKGMMSLKQALGESPTFTMEEGDKSPLEYILDIMNDPRQDPERRDRMAVAALPYIHSRVLTYKGKKAQDAENAKLVSGEWSGLLEDESEPPVN